MNSELLREIIRFAELQLLLVTEFRRAYPEATDLAALFNVPRSGCLTTTEGLWLFRKHGAGVCFINSQGVEVDAHCAFESPELFDVWRLHTYLESASELDFPEPSELEELLGELVKLNRLTCEGSLYKLVQPPKSLPLVDEPSSLAQGKTNKYEAIARLVANGLYEIRLRLGTGRVEGMEPHIDVVSRLAYALHNEALFLLGEPYEVDADRALKRIEGIDSDFPGERLFQSFQRVLAQQE